MWRVDVSSSKRDDYLVCGMRSYELRCRWAVLRGDVREELWMNIAEGGIELFKWNTCWVVWNEFCVDHFLTIVRPYMVA